MELKYLKGSFEKCPSTNLEEVQIRNILPFSKGKKNRNDAVYLSRLIIVKNHFCKVEKKGIS
jgi:hypothetical protein